MLVIRFASDDDADDALSLWKAADELIHHSLQHSRCGCNTECKSVQPVESLVSVQGEESLGFIVHLHLQIGTPQVNLREMLAATEGGEDIVNAWQ